MNSQFFIPINNAGIVSSTRASPNQPSDNNTPVHSPYGWDTVSPANSATSQSVYSRGSATPSSRTESNSTPSSYLFSRGFPLSSPATSPARIITPQTTQLFSTASFSNMSKLSPARAAGITSAWVISSDDSSKFRQLPCKTFVSVGACPYRDRCVYLHDPRIKHAEAKTKTRKKNKEDNLCDSFFWPVMDSTSVRRNLDSSNQPVVVQPYVLPPFNPKAFSNHDRAVYSTWMHFVEYCQCQVGAPPTENHRTEPDPINRCINRPRLNVFIELSKTPSPSDRFIGQRESPLQNAFVLTDAATPMRSGDGVDIIQDFGDSPATVLDIDTFSTKRPDVPRAVKSSAKMSDRGRYDEGGQGQVSEREFIAKFFK